MVFSLYVSLKYYCRLFIWFAFLVSGVCFGCGKKLPNNKFCMGMSAWKEATKNHRITQPFELEGALKDHLVQLLRNEQRHLQLDQVHSLIHMFRAPLVCNSHGDTQHKGCVLLGYQFSLHRDKCWPFWQTSACELVSVKEEQSENKTLKLPIDPICSWLLVAFLHRFFGMFTDRKKKRDWETELCLCLFLC